jgi:hypothetical protein
MQEQKEKNQKPYDHDPNSDIQSPLFHSVELLIDGLEFSYHFKIWDINANAMNIIIKEDSAIINRLKPGNRFNSKYYSDNGSYPMVELNTEISHITKAEEGRFKGHYIVGLTIDKHPNETMMH